MEQEPGPRGSPQVPQGPGPLEEDQALFPPTAKADNCFFNVVALQEGQAGAVDPWTIASKRWLHS